MHVFRAFLAGLAFAALAACASTPAPAPKPLGPPPIAKQVEELKTRLFIRVEEQRTRMDASARPLVLDPELTAAAQAHSDAMAKAGGFDPNAPSGNAAVNKLLQDPKFAGYVGENVGSNTFTPSMGIDPDLYAKAFLDSWLKSVDHSANLAFPRFNLTGIGVTVSDNTIYLSEVFAVVLGPADHPVTPEEAIGPAPMFIPPLGEGP